MSSSKMPFVYQQQKNPSSTSSEDRIIEDSNYPAVSFPGYAEKPLSEQLEPIAVVGIGCRLPGDISSPAEFWELLMNKGTGQSPKIPASRFNIDAHIHSNNERPGSFNALGGYFLNSDLQGFDPVLFGISPIEAMWMDPQQRKLLEVVYEAFESGGVTLADVSNTTTAVFTGSFTSDFQQMSFKEPDFRHSYAATGVDPGIISNRISHVFNLQGPSIVVNTACSSSVYAIHNACNALRNNEACAAIVGGTNLILTVDQHMNTAKLGVLSPTSTCHTFDITADGYGRAEAVGAVYLKRLKDAIRDGNPIRGVIRTSAVNSNGKAPAVGITYPSLQGQENVIRNAYCRGGDLDPRLTGYFEIHGTGTPVGDPIEVEAVSRAMNDVPTHGEESLLIGAVKTNIGHSEAASGLSALIKAVLSVEKGIIPPTRGLVTPNPKIKWDEWKVKVVTEPTLFPAHLPVKRVSINSFGYGGTNGHIMVESVESLVPGYKLRHTEAKLRGIHNLKRPFMIPFSAHDKPTLKRNINAYGKVASKYNLLDLSYTLGNRRSLLQSRAFAVASSVTLDAAFQNNAAAFTFAQRKKTSMIGFVFTGQGAQWPKMGFELMQYYPSFLGSIRKLDQTLGELEDGPEWILEDVLVEDALTSRVNEAEFSQPLCTAIQIAMVDLLASWDIRPIVTCGHSSGEMAASYAAGLISASEAIVIAYYRGKVVQDIDTDGAMMAVGLGADEVEPYIRSYTGKVVIACHNSPSSVTLSGDSEDLEKLKLKLDNLNILVRSVRTGGRAYHSHHMTAVVERYEALVHRARSVTPFDRRPPGNTIMVSSVTNSIMNPNQVIDEHYWSQNLVSPVLFNQAIQTIANDIDLPVNLLIEIGPHSALSGPIRQICTKFGYSKLAYMPTIVRGTDSASQLLKVAGELFLREYPLNMERITAIEESLPSGEFNLVKGSILVDLPTYQWNYAKPLWTEPRQSAEHRARKHARHDVLGSRLFGGSITEPIWRNVLRIRDIPWLNHHSLGGEAVFPAAGYFSMAIEAITQLNEDAINPVPIEGFVLRDISIKTALVTPDNDTGVEVIFTMHPSVFSVTEKNNTWWDFNISSVSEAGHWNNHMTGTISINTRYRGHPPRAIPNLPQRSSGKSWNQGLRNVGFDYGATFQDMADVRYDGKTYVAAAKTLVKQTCGVVEGESRYVLHPSTVDSCLQLIIVSIYAGRLSDMTCGAVPIKVDEIAIWTPSADQLNDPAAHAYAWTDQRGIRSFISGSQLVASDGELLMDIINMRCVAYEAAVPQKSEHRIESLPYGEMVWKHDIDSLATTSHPENIDISNLFELVAHKDSASKILEIGFSNTSAVLSAFKSPDYTIAGSSDKALQVIQHEIGCLDGVQYLKLDVTNADYRDELPDKIYDLIIATNLPSYNSSVLANIRRLVADGGHAIFSKTPGTTDESLQGAGFSGEDLAFHSKDSSTLILSTALAHVHSDDVNQQVNLIYRSKPTHLIPDLQTAFKKQGILTKTSSLEANATQPGDNVILLADLETPLLATLGKEELGDIQNITTNASTILWVTAGGLLHGKKPEHAMTAGLARSITSEQASLDLTTMDIDLETTSVKEAHGAIISATQRQLHKAESRESEYYVSNGSVYISRLVHSKAFNQAYVVDENEAKATPYDVDIPVVGKVESGKVIFKSDTRVSKPLKPGEVEVKVSYAGLNKEDILVINGSDYPTTFSHEISGVITKVGPEVSNFEVRDRVFGFSFDKFANFQRTSAQFLHKINEDESLEELSTLPMAYSAAIYGLKTLARLEANETVLILNGTSSTGAAAIKVSQLVAAKPFVLAESQQEAQELLSSFQLTKDQVILTLDPLLFLTRIEGLSCRIDVVFSCAYADSHSSRESWRHIAPFGRFVNFGRKNVLKCNVLDTLPLHRGASYLSFDILDLYARKPRVLSSLLQELIALYRQHSISAIEPRNVKNITEINSAVASYSDKITSGKILISYEPLGGVINLIPSRSSLSFRPDATYLLVGCLGGLGRSLTSWMIDKGAKRFAFLSRSGTDSEQAAILVKNIESRGLSCQVVRGDVTVLSDVERAVKGVSSEYPIRGAIQAAMVLKDGLFHSMTYSNWTAAIRPKVVGSWNLHTVLADTPLDFFVMTSSTSGTLGTPGQGNYAAACSYLDSLARYRCSTGRPASSLVLPMVLGVGYVAEHAEIEEALKRKGIYGIDEDELVEAFEAAILTQSSANPIDHIIAGMDAVKLNKTVKESETTDDFWLDDARFKSLIHTIKSGSGEKDVAALNKQSIFHTIKKASTPAEAVQIVSNSIIAKLARLLLLDMDTFEPDVKSIAAYGLDSMIGAELRNWIFKDLGLDLPFQQLLEPTLTITNLATVVCKNHDVVFNEKST